MDNYVVKLMQQTVVNMTRAIFWGFMNETKITVNIISNDIWKSGQTLFPQNKLNFEAAVLKRKFPMKHA